MYRCIKHINDIENTMNNNHCIFCMEGRIKKLEQEIKDIKSIIASSNIKFEGR